MTGTFMLENAGGVFASGSFTSPMRVFKSSSVFGYNRAGGADQLFFFWSAPYDLVSDLGPIMGDARQQSTSGATTFTNLGNLRLTAAGNGTFGAAGPPPPTVDVPEPASLLILGSGLLALGLVRRRGGSAQAAA